MKLGSVGQVCVILYQQHHFQPQQVFLLLITTHVLLQLLFCDSNYLRHKLVQEVATIPPRGPVRARPQSHTVSLRTRSQCSLILLFSSGRCSLLGPCSAFPGPTARLEQGEPPSGRCYASTLPRKGIILRQEPVEASEPQERSLS